MLKNEMDRLLGFIISNQLLKDTMDYSGKDTACFALNRGKHCWIIKNGLDWKGYRRGSGRLEKQDTDRFKISLIKNKEILQRD